MKTMIAAVAATLLLAAGASRAEVTDSQANGFQVKHQAVIAAPADTVWALLVQPSKWWSSDHTWSGSAANLSIGAASGGCFCERLPNGGSVLHMTTVNAAPGKQLVMVGGLGPLQSSGASGALDITLVEKNGQTTVTMTYDVGGYIKGGFGRITSPVDMVLGQQLQGLKKVAEAR